MWLVNKKNYNFVKNVSLSVNIFLQDVTRGLKELLDYDGNVEEDMGMNFQVWWTIDKISTRE